MSEKEEIWKPISKYPGYECSNLGQVRSFKRSNEAKVLAQHPICGSGGYMGIRLYAANGIRKMCYAHILVLETFHGPRPKFQARHKDGNHLNNRDDNLVWGTSAENILDRERHRKHQNTSKVLGLEKAREIREQYHKQTQEQLAKAYGVTARTIRAIFSQKVYKEAA